MDSDVTSTPLVTRVRASHEDEVTSRLELTREVCESPEGSEKSLVNLETFFENNDFTILETFKFPTIVTVFLSLRYRSICSHLSYASRLKDNIFNKIVILDFL